MSWNFAMSKLNRILQTLNWAEVEVPVIGEKKPGISSRFILPTMPWH